MLKRKILVVEDDRHLVDCLKAMLQERDFDVECVHTGEQAMKQLKHRPDLLLLDRTLPDRDGLEICRRVREDHRQRGLPIIILSAADSSDEKIQGLYLGADDYITKPFVAEELLARIEVVLRRVEFAEQMRLDRTELVEELDRILRYELLTPFFQPIFSLKKNQLLGYEVLSRPPVNSALSNPEFLFRMAVASGKYFELEMLGWHKAFYEWKCVGKPHRLFLNCTPHLLEQPEIERAILSEEDIAPEQIVLELTERANVQDSGLIIEHLAALKQRHFEIAVDDVGCGYASLNTIAEVKPDYLKIDVCLVHSIAEDRLKQDIVEAIVYFSKRNKIITIAEGIETNAELEKLRKLGVDAGQGFWLGRPDKKLLLQESRH